MKRVAVLGALLLLGGVAAVVADYQAPAAQQPQEKIAQIEKVKDNLFMITGGGGNTAAFITDKGVVVVDTKLDGWGQAILDKIKTVTDKPVITIINTHTHGDHVGSNDEFPPTVTTIVAHENTKTNMEKMPAFQPDDKKQYVPNKTYKDKTSLMSGKERIDLYYFGAGHTNGDTIIVWPALRTAHMGDLFSGKNTPIIDMKNGGSGLAYAKTTAAAVAGIKDVDTVIPGHAPVQEWTFARDFAEFIQTLVSQTQEAMKAGKSADDAVASLKMPDKFKDWNMNRAKANVETIYNELKASQ